MKEQKVYYRWLKFLVADYKAYEIYLNQLANKGYELMDVTPFGVGKFRKVEPRSIRYCVDIVDALDEKRYIALCEQAGWQLVHQIERIKIFKQIGSSTRVLIHTECKIESMAVSRVIFKKELWSIVLWCLWLGVPMMQYGSLGVRGLVSNFIMMYMIMVILVSISISGNIVHTFYYLFQIKTKGISNVSVTLKGAKIRRSLYYGLLTIGIGIAMLGAATESIDTLYLVACVFLFLLAMVWGINKIKQRYDRGLISETVKDMCQIGIAIAVFIGLLFAVSRGGDYIRMKCDQYDQVLMHQILDQREILTIHDMDEYLQVSIEDEELQADNSIIIKQYYRYRADMQNGYLIYEYYEGQSEWWTCLVMDMIKEDYIDDDGKLTFDQLPTSMYEVDEAYYNERIDELLLRKGNEIYHFDTREINLMSDENRQVIKDLFK